MTLSGARLAFESLSLPRWSRLVVLQGFALIPDVDREPVIMVMSPRNGCEHVRFIKFSCRWRVHHVKGIWSDALYDK